MPHRLSKPPQPWPKPSQMCVVEPSEDKVEAAPTLAPTPPNESSSFPPSERWPGVATPGQHGAGSDGTQPRLPPTPPRLSDRSHTTMKLKQSQDVWPDATCVALSSSKLPQVLRCLEPRRTKLANNTSGTTPPDGDAAKESAPKGQTWVPELDPERLKHFSFGGPMLT